MLLLSQRNVVFQLQAKMNESGFSKNVKLKWIKKPGKNIFHKEEEDRDSVKTEL